MFAAPVQTDDLIALKKANISDGVIAGMIEAQGRAK
jgi:hypothetical protein